jgi:hypothetical protein
MRQRHYALIAAGLAVALGSVETSVAQDRESDAVSLVASTERGAPARAARGLMDSRATTIRDLLNLAERALRDDRKESAIAAIMVLGDWRAEDATAFLVEHLSLQAGVHARPTLLTSYPCAGALARIGVKGLEATAQVVLGRAASPTDLEVRLLSAIVRSVCGDDLGRAYCTFKKERAEGAEAKASWDRVREGIVIKED